MRFFVSISVVLMLNGCVIWSESSARAADSLADFGAETNGLRAKVTLAKAQFSVGQPIETTFIKRNVSDKDVVIWHSGFWTNHRIIVKTAAGEDAPLTALGAQGKHAFSPGGARDKNIPLTLKPGQEDASEGAFDLTTLVDLSKPGRYTVQILYEEKRPGWTGKAESNVAEFEVVK